MKYPLIFCLICLNFGLFAQKTESPYLELLSPNAIIPLKETRTEVHIAGTIAHVHLSQIYHNSGAEAIEARYVFPLSTQAAVHKMAMTIGDRTIHARIYEKQEAQQVYQKAVSEGKRAAKLDQERPNVFQMNVGNIMPGDEISIDLYYTELLSPESATYQFVLPGVVGPRYTGENQSGETTFHNPHTPKDAPDTYHFDLSVTINAGMIIQQVSSVSHRLRIHYPDPKTAEISLAEGEKNPANRDFILNYQLRGEQIQSGLLLYEHADEKFFAYLMEPIKSPTPEQIPPREYLFIVDVSGSMTGYPLDVSKALMQNLLCNLKDTDLFNILLFASSSTCFRPDPVPVNGANIEAALHFMTNGHGGGGTELLSALSHAYGMPRKFTSSARTMVVITDGYVSVEREAFEKISSNLDQASVFTFGIGSSVNRYLIEGMSKVAHGTSFIATTFEEAQEVARKFEQYIETPLLTQVKLHGEGFDLYDVEPASIPDVFSARPVVVYGKWRGPASGKIVVTGYQGSGKFQQEYRVADATLSKSNEALRYLWARKKIEQLDDYRELFRADTRQEVIDLGLKYNLATQYTSFVAVDETTVNPKGNAKLVNQPLPMPEQVENFAVGAEAAVNETSVVSNSFQLDIRLDNGTANKSLERQLKIWFRAACAGLIKEQLGQFNQIRLGLNASGAIESVSTLVDGKWVANQILTQAFQQLMPIAPVGHQEVIITLIR